GWPEAPGVLLGRPDGQPEDLSRLDKLDGVGDQRLPVLDALQELVLHIDDQKCTMMPGQSIRLSHRSASLRPKSGVWLIAMLDSPRARCQAAARRNRNRLARPGRADERPVVAWLAEGWGRGYDGVFDRRPGTPPDSPGAARSGEGLQIG